MATARWNGEILAESPDTTIVEGNHYFPPEAVRMAFLSPSATTTHCPWKGNASYYTVQVAGAENPDAAWFYPDPLPEAAHIADHVAFWKGVEITD
ncbi:DUF427 domain-containing protein [Kitasatospora sp. MAP5-34]|uniref:DUF427 domain-containing protein n=1 Tax=Kitasatospora sp. MAP5-34 TaxID=3035102 RepID=UPI002475DAA3|nr:DUF427 domain-containing protein [Kitasatospora sp. MAP5-34]MDH6576819.1 uncharacterized protein (DUF427 family) [Kitasatospora sp. MAP5-34]